MQKAEKGKRPDPVVQEVENLASVTECTGLVPAAVQTPEEGSSYAQLYAIHEQKPACQTEKNGKSEEMAKQ